MERRQFLQTLGPAALTTAAVAGCAGTDGETSLDNTPIPTDQMTYRTDPHTGEKISLLGFGCMRYPFRPVGTGENQEELIDQEAVNAMIDEAIAHGVNYFDTSPVYCRGLSERATGVALSRHKRETFYIATKMSNMSPAARSREASLAMYQNSFKELKVDYFDYYLIHSVANYEIFKARYLDNGILDFLLQEKAAGRIRHLGWSFHGEKSFFDWMMSPECGVTWDFVQIQLNYLDWLHATGRNVNAEYLYGVLAKQRVPAVIMEPLLGGRLARTNYKAQKMLQQARPDKSAASWAMRFAGSPEGVLTVLSGMTLPEHLRDNLRSYCPLEPVSEEEKKLLEQVALTLLEFKTINCTACDYCMPCPYGLDIPGIFLYYNECLNQGRFPGDKSAPDYARAKRAFLAGYDRHVPKLRQADMCIGCNLCRPECPQFIPIVDELVNIDKFVESLRREG
ncbi:MAG: aldo/keto reductase [Planctomycetia bacterium]|nr:aldo/keto reductase [Planctomycetia bacterium]